MRCRLLDVDAGVGVADVVLVRGGDRRNIGRLRRIEIAELVRSALGGSRGERRGRQQGNGSSRAKKGRQAEAVLNEFQHDDALFLGFKRAAQRSVWMEGNNTVAPKQADRSHCRERIKISTSSISCLHMRFNLTDRLKSVK